MKLIKIRWSISGTDSSVRYKNMCEQKTTQPKKSFSAHSLETLLYWELDSHLNPSTDQRLTLQTSPD